MVATVHPVETVEGSVSYTMTNLADGSLMRAIGIGICSSRRKKRLIRQKSSTSTRGVEIGLLTTIVRLVLVGESFSMP